MKLTTNDLKNAASEIEAKFYEMGGKKEFFSEFLLTLGQSIELELTADWVVTPLDLVSQWFNERFAGSKQKVTLADIIESNKTKRGDDLKAFSFLDKEYI